MFVPYIKNVSMKCKEYVESHRHRHVMDMWKNIICSNTRTNFLVHLKHFEVVCVDIPNLFSMCTKLGWQL